MLAVLDPRLFYGARKSDISSSEIRKIAHILRRTEARIPADLTWKKIQRELIQPLSQDEELKRELDALRSFVSTIRFPEAPPRIKLWDFHTLFSETGSGWLDVMTRTLTGCVLTGEETLLITRLIPGRNVETHSGPGRCSLGEKACWDLRVKIPGKEIHRIPAVCRRRNVSVPWTARFDDRLPTESERSSFPFCPPKDWYKSSVHAFKTHQGRPAWLDAQGNYWACPSTGWGYHWDVYLEPRLADVYGLDQLNVVRWGAPKKEGVVGALHHVPREKKSRLRKETGWKC
jgi:hypothetical protein